MNKIAKKGQEEMVGFAVLVILVAVVGVGLLALALRSGGQNEISSLHVQQFSESLIQSTSGCNIGTWPSLASFSSIIDECYNFPLRQCSNGKTVCEYLNETLPALISSVWNINSESAFQGAGYTITFKNRISGEEKEVASNSLGRCASNSLGGESIIPDSRKLGNLILRIKLCLNDK